MHPPADFKLKFIAQTSGGNVGEAFRLPARKYHEFALLSGEIEPFFRTGRETRPLHPLSKQHDKLQFIVLARQRPRPPLMRGLSAEQADWEREKLSFFTTPPSKIKDF